MIVHNLVSFLIVMCLCNQALAEQAAVKKCEVCQKVINKVLDTLKADGKDVSPDSFEKNFVSYCKNTQIAVENRLVSSV